MSGRSKFLAPEVLDEAAEQVAEIAEREQVAVALCGGYALQYFGSPRLTGDIDVVADRTISGLPAGPELSFGGEKTTAPNGTPVDLIVRDDDFAELYESALEEAKQPQDVPMPVVSPEYIFAMKMVAGRARDFADIEWLIISGAIDLAKTRRIVMEHLGPYAAQEMDRLVEEAEWKAERGRT
jgi:hypothetical protein